MVSDPPLAPRNDGLPIHRPWQGNRRRQYQLAVCSTRDLQRSLHLLLVATLVHSRVRPQLARFRHRQSNLLRGEEEPLE